MWKFVFMNYVRLLSVHLKVLMDRSAVLNEDIEFGKLDAGEQTMSTGLYSLLSQMLDGSMLKDLMRVLPNENGFEAWRRITDQFEPRSGNRAAGALGFLLKHEFDEKLSFCHK